MKKEEQQKNKGEDKISFFDGVEKSKEAGDFFGKIKKFFQGDITSKPVDFQTKELPVKKDDIKKTIENKEAKNKSIPQKTDAISVKNNLPKEAVLSKANNPKSKSAADDKKLKVATSWSAVSILSTDLIKGESTIVYHWGKQITVLILNIVLVVFLVGIAYGGLLYWEQTGQAANIKLDTEANNLKIQVEDSKKGAAEINLFNEKIALIKDLLNRHIYWDNFFEFLESNILADVYLTDSFDGGVDGEYTFQAYTKDLKTMLDQVNYLRQDDKKDKIISVEIANVSISDSAGDVASAKTVKEKYKVSFDLIIKINKDIFHKK